MLENHPHVITYTHLWSLYRGSAVVANLSFIVVPPGVHHPITSAADTVERATGNVHDKLLPQGSHHSLGETVVGVVFMAQTIIITLTPVITRNQRIVQLNTCYHVSYQSYMLFFLLSSYMYM